jgi:NADH dehydrogenase
VEDVAGIAVNAGQSNNNMILDAVGPEIFGYEELIRLIADRVQSKAKIIHLRPGLALFLSKFIGYMVNDVVLTQDEVEGLMANLLVSKNPPTGRTRLSEWLSQNADVVGTYYASELARHYR